MNGSKPPIHEFSLVPTCEENVRKEQLLQDEKLFLRKRYFVAALAFLALFLNFLLRINVSICIVEMTSIKTVIINNVTHVEPPEYNWTAPQKGLILSSFSWGFLFTPLGHFVVNRFGGATGLGYTVLFTGILTILSPTLISGGMYIFMFARGFEGLSEGMTVCCLYKVFSLWIPSHERSRVVNLVFLGIPLGISISYSITGTISYLFGWKSVFYITGGMAIVWFALWRLTVADSPDLDKYITKKERHYILEHNKHLTQLTEDAVLSWRSILTSKAVLALLNERFVEAWSFSFISYCLPLYIKDVYPHNTMDIGFFSAIPNLFSVISAIVGSCMQDYFRTRTSISSTKFHKSFILFGQITAVVLLVSIGTWIDFYWSMIALCIFRIGYGIAEISYGVLPLDLCPQYANFLGSLSMGTLAIGYLLNPVVMGFMVQNHTTAEWSRYFWFLASFNLWGAVVFAKFGSGELQSWAKTGSNQNS